MSEEKFIGENDIDTEVPTAIQQMPGSADETEGLLIQPVGILRVNLERKIAAGIWVIMLILYGIVYFFFPPSVKVTISKDSDIESKPTKLEVRTIHKQTYP